MSAINACCGHGNPDEAYVQFEGKPDIRGIDALYYALRSLFEESR